jgi:hypothetical protein
LRFKTLRRRILLLNRHLLLWRRRPSRSRRLWLSRLLAKTPNRTRLLLSRPLLPEVALRRLNTPLPAPEAFPEPSVPLRRPAASAVDLWVRLPHGMALLAKDALRSPIELLVLLSPSALRSLQAVWADAR